MLGLNPYVILAVLLALLGAGVAGYAKGRTDADRSAEVRALTATVRAEKAQAVELTRQAHAANAIAGEAAIRERAASALALSLQDQLDDYARALREAAAIEPSNACALAPDDVLRLDRLRHGGPAATPVAPIPPERPAELR
jgi:hypothetical protein